MSPTFCQHLPVPEPGSKDTTLGAPATLIDVPVEVADGFGPLKTALGDITAVYSNDEVRFRPLLKTLL